MTDEIEVISNSEKIYITCTDQDVEVVDDENSLTINTEDETVNVTEEIGGPISINSVDVRLIPPSNVDVSMICSASEQVGDVVYIFSSAFGNPEVRRADNRDISTAKVMGFVVSKSSDTSCIVRIMGVVTNFTSLIPGEDYFLGLDGGVTNVATTISGSVIVPLGKALDVNRILLYITNSYYVRD